jgi:hypothetical protein
MDLECNYPLPNDEREIERVNKLGFIIRILYEFEILAPIKLQRPKFGGGKVRGLKFSILLFKCM